jgi:pilus assembly protein Flp/PilA
MRTLTQQLARFLRDEGGPTAVEYAIMLALITTVCIAAIRTLGSDTDNTFVGSKVAAVGS